MTLCTLKVDTTAKTIASVHDLDGGGTSMASAIDESVSANAATNQMIPVSDVEYQTTICQLRNPSTNPKLTNALDQTCSFSAEFRSAQKKARHPIKTKFRVGESSRKKLKLVMLARLSPILFQKPDCVADSKAKKRPMGIPNT